MEVVSTLMFCVLADLDLRPQTITKHIRKVSATYQFIDLLSTLPFGIFPASIKKESIQSLSELVFTFTPIIFKPLSSGLARQEQARSPTNRFWKRNFV